MALRDRLMKLSHPRTESTLIVAESNRSRVPEPVLYRPLLPQRVCCAWPGAMPVQHARVPEQAQESTPQAKINVTSKSPVGDISVVTLIRTDTTLDHSQKAEKV